MLADAIRRANHNRALAALNRALGDCQGCKQRRGLIQRHVDLWWYRLKVNAPAALIAVALGAIVVWLAVVLFLVERTAHGAG